MIHDPARGSKLDGDPAQTISGSAFAKAGKIKNLFVNGVVAALDENGGFSSQMISQLGMNVLEAEGHDQYGGYTLLTQTYYYSKNWHPFGDEPPAGAWVAGGIRVILKKELFDDGDTGDMDDFASYLAAFLTPETINSLIVNPAASGVFDGCSYEASIYDVWYAPADLDIKPEEGGISISVELVDFSASVVSSVTGDDCFAISGLLSVDALTVNMSVGISLSEDGVLEITAGDPVVGISGLKINGEEGSLFAPFMRDAFQKAISKDLVTILSSDLKDALAHLVIDVTYLVPPALENGLAAQVNIKTKLEEVEFSDDGAALALSALINAPNASGYETNASIGMAECIQQPAAGIQTPGSIDIFIHDDILNQLLFAMHRGGMLKGQFNDTGVLQQYGITDIAIEVDFLLPPIVNSCKAGEKYFLQAGDVFVEASFKLLGVPVEFLLFAAVEASGNLSIDTSAADYKLSFKPDAVGAARVDVVAINGIEGADEAYYEGLLEDEILPALFSEFLGDSIFSMSYPIIDLTGILDDFQGGDSVEVHQPQRINGRTVLPLSL